LLSYGADPNVKGQNNQTASDIAEEQADTFLLSYIKGIRGTRIPFVLPNHLIFFDRSGRVAEGYWHVEIPPVIYITRPK